MCTLSLPKVALLGLDKVTITVSFSSSMESSAMFSMVMLPDVEPALIVRVPFAKVKSVPDPVAVPVTA